MTERREKRKRWVQRGEYAVEDEVEVVHPPDDPSEACLEPATVRWLDEVARKAEEGDVEFLRRVGRVFQAVPLLNGTPPWRNAEKTISNTKSESDRCRNWKSSTRTW